MPIARMRPLHTAPHANERLIPVGDFVPDPGQLSGHVYVPASLGTDAPLVVVLHGCTQDAVGYATAAGWLELADRHGFAVLLPQQARHNNANLCFNWFEQGDTRRGHGEAASIKAMIDQTVARHALDPARIFVTGLSAGAAMAGTLLATYPEIFAGGGLIAGLPHGIAGSVQAALQQMRSATRESGPQLAERVFAASNHRGSWPRVSVWHGSADHTVSPANGEATLAQWLAVHDLQSVTPASESAARHRRRTWHDADGNAQVEHIEIKSMGHGTPINPSGLDGVGKAAPYVLDTGVASSVHLLAFWGIAEAPAVIAPIVAPVVAPSTAVAFPTLAARPTARRATRLVPMPRIESGIEKVINDALRVAGLMK